MDEEMDASQVAETFSRTERLDDPGLGAPLGVEGGLTRSAAKGMGWTWASVAGTMAMQLVYTAVMARNIDPRAFGLVASALVGLRFVTYLSNFSLGSAVVQRQVLDDEDTSTALILSVVIGIVVAALAALVSPVLAAVVRAPESAVVMRWFSLGLLLSAVATIPEALLRRSLRFRAITITQVVSFAVAYLVVGINLALRGWGVWSLVTASLLQSAILVCGYFAVARPRLPRAFSRASARSLLGFGGTVTLTSFLEFLTSGLDVIAVGRWVGAAGLGQYTRGSYLVQLPVEQTSNAMTRVLMPALSRVQSERERFVQAFLHGCGIIGVMVVVPVALAACAAPALVSLVLGPGWAPAAAVLPIVGAAIGVAMLTHLPGLAAEAQGTVGVKLWIQVATLAAVVTAMGTVVALGPSLAAFAWCWLGAEVLRFGLYWIFVLPRLGVTRSALGLRYAGAITLALAAAIPVFGTVRVAGSTGPLALVVSVLAGLGVAGATALSPCGRLLRLDLRAVRARLRPT